MEKFKGQILTTCIEQSKEAQAEELRKYVYDDLCIDIVYELCNTSDLSNHADYKKYKIQQLHKIP